MVAAGRVASNRRGAGSKSGPPPKPAPLLGSRALSAASHVPDAIICAGFVSRPIRHEDPLDFRRPRDRVRRVARARGRDAIARPFRDRHALSPGGRREIGRAVPVRRRRLESGRRRHGAGARARRRDGRRHRRAEAAREPRQGWRSLRVPGRRSREPLPLHPKLREAADVSHARARRLLVGRDARVRDARAGAR